MSKRNKYPQRKKCPACGKLMSDGETCHSNPCTRLPRNTEKPTFKPKFNYGREQNN